MTGFRSVLALIPAVLLCAQQPDKPPEKCAIEGQVLNALTGEPIRKAIASATRLEGQNRGPFSGFTDASGRFAIQELEPGSYQLYVSRTGYLDTHYGARGRGQSTASLALEPGRHMRDILFKMAPQAVALGRVVDEDGEPMEQVQVQVMRSRYSRGQRQLMAAGGAITDDLGEFRIYGLAAGRYYLVATYRSSTVWARDPNVENSSEEGYATTYYPGSSDPAGATALVLNAGEERRGLNLTLRKIRTVRIRGRVTDSTGARPGRKASRDFPGSVMLIARDQAEFSVSRIMGGVRAQGDFEIRAVPPGSYTLLAVGFDDNIRARLAIDVGNNNLDNINLTFTPPTELRGQVRAEGQSDTSFAYISVGLRTRTGPGATRFELVKDDGSFTLPSVPADIYNVEISGEPDGYYVKAIRMGERDVLQSGVDLTHGGTDTVDILLANKAGEITGAVLNAQDRPASGSTVTLVPNTAQRDQFRLFKTAVTDNLGRFNLKGIAPGEYKIFAWEEIEGDAVQDPDFLRPFEARGEAVSIREGSHETKQLKAIPAADTSPQKGS